MARNAEFLALAAPAKDFDFLLTDRKVNRNLALYHALSIASTQLGTSFPWLMAAFKASYSLAYVLRYVQALYTAHRCTKEGSVSMYTPHPQH